MKVVVLNCSHERRICSEVFVMAYELIPIGTVLALLTNQVIKTAKAAKDILVERESFRILSNYLSDIEPVLTELQRRDLGDSPAARLALESLEQDVKKANNLVDKYKDRARIYLLLKCRHIVKEIQDVTRGIGSSLNGLLLASVEVLMDMSEQVNRLQSDMQRAKFQTCQTQDRIVEKLDQCFLDQKADQGFANDILEEIVRALKISVEPREIRKEIASFKQEKQEAAAQKNRAEEYFLQQVIELLSRADAAKDQEEIKKYYFRKVKPIEKMSEDNIPLLQAFICPIQGRGAMVDPVSLCTGTTCEKAAIEEWFSCGKINDPKTNETLVDRSLRPNHQLRRTIEEWRELNYCLKIRSIKKKMQSGMDTIIEEALVEMQEIVTENTITKDWVSLEGLIDLCLKVLGNSHNKDIKKRVLIVLKATVEGHCLNKEKIIDSRGMDHIVPCLGRSLDVSKPAVELLYDLLHDGNGWNLSAARKVSEQSSAILFLVLLINKGSIEKAETILLKLCNENDDNVIRAAKVNWYKPLIDRLVHGPETSKIALVKELVQMEFVDQSLKSLGEVGVIPLLLGMVSGNLESKELAFSALLKLSTCHENKKLLAAAGVIPRVLENLLSSQVPTIIIGRCCEILERLSSSDDGTEFFKSADGSFLELENTVIKLLELQQNISLSYIIRKPALRTLHGFCKSQEIMVVKAAVRVNGVSLILPLLDHPDHEIQEVSLNLLFHFSKHEPQEIVQFLLLQGRLDKLVSFLVGDNRTVQTAAVGLLANLPKSETEITKKLIEAYGLHAILKILKSGTIEAKENALGALFRFTDPTNLQLQRLVVGMGVYPLLVSFLKSGTLTAKARAAALIGNLSLSSTKLTGMRKTTNFWRFGNTRVPTCAAHGTICSVASTFCILKADALPELVSLLHEKVEETTFEALQALSTLVQEEEYHRGASVLHAANAINPILEVLNWGTSSLKEEALGILEIVLLSPEMVDLYGVRARLHLVSLTTQNTREDDHLRTKAVRIFRQLERYLRTSMPLV